MSTPSPTDTPMNAVLNAIKDHAYWDLVEEQRHAISVALALMSQTIRNSKGKSDPRLELIDRLTRLISCNKALRQLLIDAFEATNAYDQVMATISMSIQNDIDNAIAGNAPLTGLDSKSVMDGFRDSRSKLVDIVNKIADTSVDVYSDIK